MDEDGSLLLRPGTIVLFIFIGLIGLGMYSWANTSLGNTGERSLESQSNTISCSGFDIERVELNSNESYAEIFFKANKDARSVSINFEGDSNVTKTIESVDKGSLQKIGANISNFSEVSLKASSCDQVFVYE